jgi:gamma-glutamyltranspeptidase/glutathione hydrolase
LTHIIFFKVEALSIPNYIILHMKKKLNLHVHLILLTLSIFVFSDCQRLKPRAKENEIENTHKVIITANERADHKSAEARGSNFAVATQGIYATMAAKDIFSRGGNAIDAAVAASFVLAVERPHSTGIGGGGFMLFREGRTKKIFAVDFRERAPQKAHEKMFLDSQEKIIPNLSINGVLATAVPGLVAGLLEIHNRFGLLSREKIMAPAIKLAEIGFPIYPSLAKALLQKESVLALDPEASRIFLDQNKKAYAEGHILIQKDLAKTLRLIAEKGKAGFYEGKIANEYATLFSNGHKGLISKKDLATYEVKWRQPVIGHYNGNDIYSMPPPSSGGIHIIQFLNMLEGDHLKTTGLFEAQSIHLAAEAFQSAFADRAHYLGDSDFTKVPVAELISKEYAKKRRSEFDNVFARASRDVFPGKIPGYEHTETTHLSLMDKEGNVVSTTQTINGYMGASVVVPNTGIVLNNEMDDFTALVGAANLFGAIGGSANAIAPGKAPLSSMTPTIVLRDGIPLMSLGAPGGTRIITCVAQTLLNYLEFKLPLYESIAAIRYHHQWSPDQIDIDLPGPRKDVFDELLRRGHHVNLQAVPCNVMAVTHEENLFHAVSDPRDIGTSSAL